jgi:hypothetical protein
MKRGTIASGLLALALAVGLCMFTPTTRAQSQNQDPNQHQTQDHQQNQQKTDTYVGQVIKAKNGQYALLVDRQQGKGFYLDNQDKAKQFEGKTVKVIGVLEASTSTIHVTDILPA